MNIEICAPSLPSALAAQQGGAHRIELCQQLAVGGVTPNTTLIKEVLTQLSIPVFVLIRPRGGNFVYSKAELDTMHADIELCKELGCAGIVSGVLLGNGHIDVEQSGKLVEAAYPLPFTFHRAFDETSNAFQALTCLIEIGAKRVLTSGHKNTAEEGLENLMAYRDYVKGELTILPGGSIRSANAFKFKEAGLLELHSSAILPGERHSNPEEVKKLVAIAKA